MVLALTDKEALITGAGEGIGRAAALLLSKRGAKVAALDRTHEELDHKEGGLRWQMQTHQH